MGFIKHQHCAVYVKEEYYSAFCQEWQKEWDKNAFGINYVHGQNIMAKVLGVDEIERFDWEVSV